MEKTSFDLKVRNATKWSTITELMAKLVAPVVQMILARIIDKEALGIVTIVNMVISFSEIFVDAGFQKYIIQHEFMSDEEYNKYSNVAYWTNIFVAMIIFCNIFFFRDALSTTLGMQGYETALVIASIQILITPLVSVQTARFRRNFNFKTLFGIRFIGSMIPLVITVPLALLGMSYWSLIIGTLCSVVYNAIALSLKSGWKPGFFYSISILKQMFSYSMWTLIDQMVIWFTAWIDSFIIGTYLSAYYLGLYKTPVNMMTSLLGIFSAALTPVLFSTLSRLQFDKKKIADVFLKFQKILAYILLPLGVGGFIYQSTVSNIVLGKGWEESHIIIGLTILTLSIRTIFVSLYSEMWRAIGKPKISLLLQLFDLLLLLCGSMYSIRRDFMLFVYVRAFLRLDLIIPEIIVMRYQIGTKIKKIINSAYKPIICVTVMAIFAIVLQRNSNSLLTDFMGIGISAFVYFVAIRVLAKNDYVEIIENLKSSFNK